MKSVAIAVPSTRFAESRGIRRFFGWFYRAVNNRFWVDLRPDRQLLPGALEKVATTVLLGCQITLTVPVGRKRVRHPFDDLNTAIGKRSNFLRIIGQ